MVGFPRGNDSDVDRITVGVHHDKQIAKSAHTKCNESLFVDCVGIISGKRAIVFKYCRGFRETDVVVPKIRLSFYRIPRDIHASQRIDKCPPRQRLR